VDKLYITNLKDRYAGVLNDNKMTDEAKMNIINCGPWLLSILLS